MPTGRTLGKPFIQRVAHFAVDDAKGCLSVRIDKGQRDSFDLGNIAGQIGGTYPGAEDDAGLDLIDVFLCATKLHCRKIRDFQITIAGFCNRLGEAIHGLRAGMIGRKVSCHAKGLGRGRERGKDRQDCCARDPFFMVYHF